MASKTETLELAGSTVTIRLQQQCKERVVGKDGETTLLHCYRLCEWNLIIDANTSPDECERLAAFTQLPVSCS